MTDCVTDAMFPTTKVLYRVKVLSLIISCKERRRQEVTEETFNSTTIILLYYIILLIVLMVTVLLTSTVSLLSNFAPCSFTVISERKRRVS